jgi:hypothetical protein
MFFYMFMGEEMGCVVRACYDTSFIVANRDETKLLVLLLPVRMRPNLSSIPMKHLMKLIHGSTATC